MVEQLQVLLAGQQQLQLLDVGQQDARLAARLAHRFAAGALFSRVQRHVQLLVLHVGQLGLVVGGGAAGRQAHPRHIGLQARRLAHVHAKAHARTRQQRAHALQLVFGQRVHRVDDHRRDAGRGRLVAQPQATADDGQQKTFGLA